MLSNGGLPLWVRADADAAQGTGHVLRTLALAHAWRERGGRVRYLIHRPAATLRRRLDLVGAAITEIEKPYPDEADLKTVRALLGELKREYASPPWVILDGYHFGADYQRALKHSGCRLLVIDDNAHLPCYHADIVVNHGIHGPKTEYGDGGDAWFLLGTRYALLRREFAVWRGFVRRIPQTAKKILVTLGGADAGNATVKVLEALSLLGDLALQARVLAGPLNPHLGELRRVASVLPNVELHSDVADPAPLMAWADIAISAAGTTALELAFMQVPTLLLVVAENQAPVAEGIAAFGAARSLGRADELSVGAIAEAVRQLMHDSWRRRRMADRGKMLVDGQGPTRVLAAMERRESGLGDAELTISPVSPDDELLLWQWVNDPVARRNSFNSGAISWDEHERWCAEKSTSPDCRRWILWAADLPVGQIRYERESAAGARLSFSVAPGFRGHGFGTRLLQSTVELAGRELGVRWVEGAALVHNQASRHAFLKAGFVAVEERTIGGKDCVVFRRDCGAPVGEDEHAFRP